MLQGTLVKIAGEMQGGEGIVVGTMAYSDNDRIVLVAADDEIGMPINICWLSPVGSHDEKRAAFYRERYLSQFPETLK